MIRLLFIVPYPELREKVEYVCSHHPQHDRVNADIRTMTVDETPDVPDGEYDAIIARGYTAQKTSARYDIPTIPLAISGFDIIRAISESKKLYHPSKIAICGFGNVLFEAEEICGLLGVKGEVFAPVKNEELPQAVNQAAASGCDVLIGGFSACLLAGTAGLPAVVIRTSEDTISQALDEAIRLVDRIRQERIVSQMYKTIIYSSVTGLLYVDRSGYIRVRNRVARAMNGNVSLMNRPLKSCAPWLEKTFRTVISTGKEDSQLVTIPGTRTTVSAKCVPVIANDEISGTVFHLSDVSQIQELENQIRRKLSDRGLKAKYTFADILHNSNVIERTIELARRYAASDSNVLIIGETGTGKELFAQSIHNASSRRNSPFVAVNCAALPENLLESELFGYVEGAFTGAGKSGKMGLFEQAHGGTVFLDEIAEISPSIQSKLLRVLQEHQVRRIGDNKVISVNVRIISATNRSITRLAERGEFRHDLAYRLDVLRLFIPPLRERGNDAELLFLRQLELLGLDGDACVKKNALALLQEYPFRGNVRELQNVAERAAVLSGGRQITAEILREALEPRDVEPEPFAAELRAGTSQETGSRSFGSPAFAAGEPEPDRIRLALKITEGNRSRAAALLGIDRTTLWRKIRKYGL